MKKNGKRHKIPSETLPFLRRSKKEVNSLENLASVGRVTRVMQQKAGKLFVRCSNDEKKHQGESGVQTLFKKTQNPRCDMSESSLWFWRASLAVLTARWCEKASTASGSSSQPSYAALET